MASFNNQATLTYNGTSINSNITTGELLETLMACKTAVVNTYRKGDKVTFVVSISNSGSIPYTGLTITDDLGKYHYGSAQLTPLTYVPNSIQYYVGGVIQPAPIVSSESPLVVTGIQVPAGSNAMLIYEAELNQFAPQGLEDGVINTATITGGGLSSPLTAKAEINPVTGPNLNITKSLCPLTVSENGTLTYTFTIQNTGNAEANISDAVTLTDNFNPILNNIVVTFNGTVWSSPSEYMYNTATGVFSTVPGAITVPAATFEQNPSTGEWKVTPGVSTLTVSGTV